MPYLAIAPVLLLLGKDMYSVKPVESRTADKVALVAGRHPPCRLCLQRRGDARAETKYLCIT
eukprot:6201905-Pleurochrysis_carterae.AAC.1